MGLSLKVMIIPPHQNSYVTKINKNIYSQIREVLMKSISKTYILINFSVRNLYFKTFYNVIWFFSQLNQTQLALKVFWYDFMRLLPLRVC